MVFNKEGNVFCGQRLDNKVEAWQLPQGGIDKGEIPIEAGYRELKEETSITNVEFINEYPEWLNYDISELMYNQNTPFYIKDAINELLVTVNTKLTLYGYTIKDQKAFRNEVASFIYRL